MKTLCLALDLKDDPALMAEYLHWHQNDVIWPEVIAAIRSTGVVSEKIFLLGTRMVMVLEAGDEFSLDEAGATLAANDVMQRWEVLMDKFQQRLPQAAPGQKWVPMDLIFEI